MADWNHIFGEDYASRPQGHKIDCLTVLRVVNNLLKQEQVMSKKRELSREDKVFFNNVKLKENEVVIIDDVKLIPQLADVIISLHGYCIDDLTSCGVRQVMAQLCQNDVLMPIREITLKEVQSPDVFSFAQSNDAYKLVVEDVGHKMVTEDLEVKKVTATEWLNRHDVWVYGQTITAPGFVDRICLSKHLVVDPSCHASFKQGGNYSAVRPYGGSFKTDFEPYVLDELIEVDGVKYVKADVVDRLKSLEPVK